MAAPVAVEDRPAAGDLWLCASDAALCTPVAAGDAGDCGRRNRGGSAAAGLSLPDSKAVLQKPRQYCNPSTPAWVCW